MERNKELWYYEEERAIKGARARKPMTRSYVPCRRPDHMDSREILSVCVFCFPFFDDESVK
jgi:hypothetical protein